MEMMTLAYIPAVCIVLWLLLWILIRFCIRKALRKFELLFKVKMSVNHIGMRAVYGINIEREGLFKVDVEYIRISSCLFSKRSRKLITCFVGSTSIYMLNCSQDERLGNDQKITKTQNKERKLGTNRFVTTSLMYFLPNVAVSMESLLVTSKLSNISFVWSTEMDIAIFREAANLCFQTLLGNCKATALLDEVPLMFVEHDFCVKTSVPSKKALSYMTHKVMVRKLHVNINEEMISETLKLQRFKDKSKICDISTSLNEAAPMEHDPQEKVTKIIGQLPKLISVSLENVKIIYRLNNGREIQTDWNCVLAWQRMENDESQISLDVLGLVVNGTNYCKLFLLKQWTTKISIVNPQSDMQLNVKTKLDSCHFEFIYEELFFWNQHFRSKFSSFSPDESSVKTTKQTSSLRTYTSFISLNVELELENVSCDFYFTLTEAIAASLCTVYLGQISFTGESRKEIVNSACQLTVTNVYIYVNIEEIITDMACVLPCQLQHDASFFLPISERHVWGRLFELGKLELKVNHQDERLDFESNCRCVFVEMSLAMAHSLLILLRKTGYHKKLFATPIPTRNKPSGLQTNKMCCTGAARITNMNVFLIGGREGGFDSMLLRSSNASLALSQQLTVDLSDLHMVQLVEIQNLKTGDPMVCQQKFAKEIMRALMIKISYTNKELNVNVSKFDVEWSPNIHMCMQEQAHAIHDFKEYVCDIYPKNEKSLSVTRSSIGVKCTCADATLVMQTHEKHSFGVQLKEMYGCLSNQAKHIKVHQTHLLFDDAEILSLQTVLLKELPMFELSMSRAQFKNLSAENRAWAFFCEEFHLNFPCGFNFANSLEKLQVCIKMMKQLSRKSENTNTSPDLLISIKNFSFGIEDDPFEVRLGDNYMLLSDEIEQSMEREAKLEARIEEIKSERGTHVSTKKLEELRNSLKQRNALIYIARSKEMHENRPAHKHMFVIRVKDLELSIHADASMNGTENILEHIRRLDESEVPLHFEFSTLWSRNVNGKFEFMKIVLRDYPQPLVFMESFSIRGLVCGSETSSTTEGVVQSTREVAIDIGYPWKPITIIKNMCPLKFYYDLKWDMASCQLGHGANFEPAIAMVSQSFEKLSKPSIDPSRPLPFWDKMRLLFHGNLKADIADLNILLSASTDPYNTTEKLEIEWSAATLEWTDGVINIDGNFDMFTRNASKYNDSKVLHFPMLRLNVQLEWICSGDSKDHHNVLPINPKFTKQNHDSYALFRSSNLNMNVSMEISKQSSQTEDTSPRVFLYASTFRWFQYYQGVLIRRVSRPIKRGTYFKNVRPKKLPLSRHYKLVGIELSFPCLNVTYWGSFQQEQGFEACLNAGKLVVAYQVFISPHPDDMNLVRRPVANWIIRGLSSHFDDVHVFLLQSTETTLSAVQDDEELLCIDEEGTLKKHYFFSVNKVDYKRQSSIVEDSFIHKIVLDSFKGAWTAANRELVFGLLEAYSKMQMLKKVLSSEALKVTTVKSVDTTIKREKTGSYALLDSSSTKSPMTRMQSGHGLSLLQQLVDEKSSKFIVQVEENESVELDIDNSQQDDNEDDDDVIQKNWHIELVNSQVLLHGTETKGAIIVTSGNATILKRLHLPICEETGNKLNKVTWGGKFRNLQYFSTIENFKDITVDNIPWLTNHIIIGDNGPGVTDLHSINAFTRTSSAVGAFVEVRVKGVVRQLQRVISRCRCQFNYVSLDDELDPLAEEFAPVTSVVNSDIESNNNSAMASSLTLKHGKLEMSTSNSQYEVISDICRNLILYTEPKKKEEAERLEKMKFQLQLTAGRDIKADVSLLQNRVRDTQMLLRHYERKLYEYKKQEAELAESESPVEEVVELVSDIQEQIRVTKDQLYEDVEELKILINAYGDVTLSPLPQKNGSAPVRKRIDICFDDMQWLITQQNGQLGIANVFIKKFKYNQLTFADNCSENLFEVGHFSVKNLLPNEIYREALVPHEVNIRRRVDKTVMLRIYCRVSPAVAGIMMKEHFEVNVCPIAVRLTHKLFVNMESFLFPKPQVERSGLTDPQTEFQMAVRAPLEHQMNYGKEDEKDTEPPAPATPKVPPRRPPPPRHLSPALRRSSTTSTSDTADGAKQRKAMSLSTSDLPQTQSSTKGTSFKRISFRGVNRSVTSADRDVITMKERASKNQTFIYVKIPEVPVCFSYKGEKERNIEDAHDFNLCLPTLEYQSRTWTWQDLFQAMKKDYVRILVPQILKEKLHLKSAGPDTKPSIAQVDDSNKTKLLFGEKSANQHKKSTKKLLFGKLLKTQKTSSADKLNEQGLGASASQTSESKALTGKGVEPNSLEHAFNKLRDLGGPDT